MKTKLAEIRDSIKEHNAASKIQVKNYESAESWSYAYLTRWVVLENGVKSLYDFHNKKRIRQAALNWLAYLDGELPKVPDTIKDFSVQTQNLPRPAFITKFLGTCNSIKEALDSTKKYRIKRNSIAHRAEEFKSEKSYLVHKKVIDLAIRQLLTKLSQKINISK